MILSTKSIEVGARDSRLSQVQVLEVLLEIQKIYPEVEFVPQFFKTLGDIDQTTSLLTQEGTDFFTQEIDRAVLSGRCRIGIHSSKDLPQELPLGLVVVAYTKGIDPSDVLVFPKGGSLAALSKGSRVGTSSFRRIENLKLFREDLVPVDIRGSIEKRLALLDEGLFDAVVIAKAALIRLGIERESIELPGKEAFRQGSLAVVARSNDIEMKELFASINNSGM